MLTTFVGTLLLKISVPRFHFATLGNLKADSKSSFGVQIWNLRGLYNIMNAFPKSVLDNNTNMTWANSVRPTVLSGYDGWQVCISGTASHLGCADQHTIIITLKPRKLG